MKRSRPVVVKPIIILPEKKVRHPKGRRLAGGDQPLQRTPPPEAELEVRRSRARACLLGGAIGDALGAPIEFLTLAQIRHRYGNDGVTDLVAGPWPAGTITDDTQMTLFTAEGMIRAQMRAHTKGLCHPPSVVCHAYLRWLLTQGMKPAFEMDRSSDGLLLGVRELYVQRAPGNTCLSALAAMTRIEGGAALNDSKGCGGVMRMAPVGLFDACKGQEFEYGRQFAALTHGHPTGYLAAGAFAFLIGELFRGTPLSEAIGTVIAELIRYEHHEETHIALRRALTLAEGGAPTPEKVESLGGGWVAEEALAIAVYCALTANSFDNGVLAAVNHSGDSDSTGSITGNLLGLIHGEAALPKSWLARLELREIVSRVAEDLVDSPNFRSVPDPSPGEPRGWHVYPGD